MALLSYSAPHRRPRPSSWIGCRHVQIKMASSHCPRPPSGCCPVLSSRMVLRCLRALWPWSPTPQSPRAGRTSVWKPTARTWRPACWGTPCCTLRWSRLPWTCYKGNTCSSEPVQCLKCTLRLAAACSHRQNGVFVTKKTCNTWFWLLQCAQANQL